MSALPELDRGALVMADLAFIETPGTLSDRVQVAIKAYQWAAEFRAAHGGVCPSLNELRAVLA